MPKNAREQPYFTNPFVKPTTVQTVVVENRANPSAKFHLNRTLGLELAQVEPLLVLKV